MALVSFTPPSWFSMQHDSRVCLIFGSQLISLSSHLPTLAVALSCTQTSMSIHQGRSKSMKEPGEYCGISRGWTPGSMLLYQRPFPRDTSCQWHRNAVGQVAIQNSSRGSQLIERMWSPASALINCVTSGN